MHMSMQSSSPPPSTSRYADDPGYLAPVEGRRAREQHRGAVRAQGLRERRSEAEEPSHHQMCSLLLDALALTLAEAQARGDRTIAQAFAGGLRSAKRLSGWRMSDELCARVARRLKPDADDLRDHLADVQGRRDAATIAAAREQARQERSDRIRFDRMRRHGIDPLDAEFTWGDDEPAGSAE